ncbi:hypothetical protein BURMUCF1_3186 [Burkholderia multivorans ATCC BAA-247]|nr:hypothetical protein BURMUCF1_3186 [Burkholderia multivorans ATCC BAA-247]
MPIARHPARDRPHVVRFEQAAHTQPERDNDFRSNRQNKSRRKISKQNRSYQSRFR